MRGFVGFLLLNILIGSPVHALTIVDIEEISTVVWRQDTSDCRMDRKNRDQNNYDLSRFLLLEHDCSLPGLHTEYPDVYAVQSV